MKKTKLLGAFALPSEATAGPHIELNGSAQLIADGCLGILHFDEEKISLNCGKLVVEIEGEQLTMRHLSESEAEVKGCIRRVKLL